VAGHMYWTGDLPVAGRHHYGSVVGPWLRMGRGGPAAWAPGCRHGSIVGPWLRAERDGPASWAPGCVQSARCACPVDWVGTWVGLGAARGCHAWLARARWPRTTP
jgi:hypothetical protein